MPTKKKTLKKNPDDKSKFQWIEELKNFNIELNDPARYLDRLKTDFFNNRIFIFTPQGDVVDLPEDSSPIDFAYSIHSDIGDHIFGAKVNGKIAPILSSLKNGDIVEIMTKKDSHPSSKWLDFSKTNIAKKNIRAYLEKHSLLSKLKSFGRS
ncbi:MAG: TGS domain-containing protein [Candidatus Paceibacterota bacterium]